jgi:pyridoxamine 5'-phosphate oxidase
MGLRRGDLEADPLAQFQRWFQQASGAKAGGRLRRLFIGIYKSLFMPGAASGADVNAMTLATCDKEGRPSARVVLLKGVDERGFIFFTNYESRKANELTENPQAALVFYWPELERQVCVAGRVTRLGREESEAYFVSRPRGSRIAAWASKQSETLRDRTELEEKWRRLEKEYDGHEVPIPPYWGGYVLSPDRIEFWQGRPNRMHDRFRYTKEPTSNWRIERLSP